MTVMAINMKKVEKNRIVQSLNLTNLQLITALGRTRCTFTRWKDDPRDHNCYKIGRCHRQFSVVFTGLSVFRGPILWFDICNKANVHNRSRNSMKRQSPRYLSLMVFAYTDTGTCWGSILSGKSVECDWYPLVYDCQCRKMSWGS